MLLFLLIAQDPAMTAHLDQSPVLESTVLLVDLDFDFSISERFENGNLMLGSVKEQSYFLYSSSQNKLTPITQAGPGPNEINAHAMFPNTYKNQLVTMDGINWPIKSLSQAGKAAIIGNGPSGAFHFISPSPGIIFAVSALPGKKDWSPNFKDADGSLFMFAEADGKWEFIESLLPEDFKGDNDLYARFTLNIRLRHASPGFFYRIPGLASRHIQVLDASGAVVREFKWPHPFVDKMPITPEARLSYIKKNGRPLSVSSDSDSAGNLYLLLWKAPVWRDDAWVGRESQFIVKVNEMGKILATYRAPFPIKAFSVSADGQSFYCTDLDRDKLLRLTLPDSPLPGPR